MPIYLVDFVKVGYFRRAHHYFNISDTKVLQRPGSGHHRALRAHLSGHRLSAAERVTAAMHPWAGLLMPVRRQTKTRRRAAPSRPCDFQEIMAGAAASPPSQARWGASSRQNRSGTLIPAEPRSGGSGRVYSCMRHRAGGARYYRPTRGRLRRRRSRCAPILSDFHVNGAGIR